jgi:hypothetical protein
MEQEFTDWALTGQGGYQSFLSGLIADFQSSVMNDGLTITGRARFTSNCFARAESYLVREINAMDALIPAVVERALGAFSELRAVEIREDVRLLLGEHLSESKMYFSGELSAQLLRDVSDLSKSLQVVGLEVSAAARIRNIPERVALIEMMISRQDPTFAFRDRAGRRIRSTVFVRNLWRQTLLSVHNEITLIGAGHLKMPSCAVMQSELDLSLTQIGSVFLDGRKPSYGEVRQGLFHPNSQSFLAPERVNVSA